MSSPTLEALPKEKWPARVVVLQEEGQPVSQFLMLRPGIGYLRFCENEKAEEKDMPTLYISLAETEFHGITEPEQMNPEDILLGIEFPNKQAYDTFMMGLRLFGEKHFPENP